MADKNRMRVKALSVSSAASCENATTLGCRCRCRGAFHGSARGKLSGLPVDDPHSPSSECKKCNGTGKRKEIDWTATGLAIGEPYPEVERECFACKGTGRVIKPAVERALRKLEAQA